MEEKKKKMAREMLDTMSELEGHLILLEPHELSLKETIDKLLEIKPEFNKIKYELNELREVKKEDRESILESGKDDYEKAFLKVALRLLEAVEWKTYAYSGDLVDHMVVGRLPFLMTILRTKKEGELELNAIIEYLALHGEF